jgi:hypothetical protein
VQAPVVVLTYMHKESALKTLDIKQAIVTNSIAAFELPISYDFIIKLYKTKTIIKTRQKAPTQTLLYYIQMYIIHSGHINSLRTKINLLISILRSRDIIMLTIRFLNKFKYFIRYNFNLLETRK